MNFIEAANWRYATKRFDPSKEVAEQDIESIRKSAMLSATSYGLQFFKVLEISKGALRTALREASWNQPQLEEASEIFVLCVPTSVSEKDISENVAFREQTLSLPSGTLKGYGDFIYSKLSPLPADAIEHWLSKQTYIVLANMMNACAMLQVDSCPMEGFSAESYDKILGLTEKGLTATVVLAIGYRNSEDTTASQKKIRKPIADLFERI